MKSRALPAARGARGFTVIELVIVIAVVAVLAAVLIPTFTGLIRRANDSADQQLLRGVNLALSAASAGTRPYTMHDALSAVAENGYNLEKLTPRTDRDIVWDSEKNEFLLFAADEAPAYAYRYWKIATSADDLAGSYSYYLTFPIASVEAKAGIDVGAQEGVNIRYAGTEAQNIVFRTRGGSLTVDNANATVAHYGQADEVTVVAVRPGSFREYGEADYFDLRSGKLSVEASGSIGTLDTANATGAVSLSSVQNDAIGLILTGEEDLALPEGLRAEQSGKTTVGSAEEWNALFPAAGEEGNRNGTADYIVLTSDIAVSDVIFIGRSVTIDGGGHTLSTTASRVLRVNRPNVALTLKNVSLSGGSGTQRGIQVDGGITGVTLKMERITLGGISYYGINICNGAGVDITLSDSAVTAWGALNLWSADYAVRVYNSRLNGINDKTYNAAGWNDFATVVLEGDTTGKTTDRSSIIDVTLVNTVISATQTTGNRQQLIGFNTGATGNTLTMNGCRFIYGGEAESGVFKEEYRYDDGQGNRILIDGKLFRE